MNIKRKVFAYITNGERLLVFRHPYSPEAGIQVPAGTIEEHGHAEEAVMREAYEETGLTDLSLHCFLGEDLRDMSDFGRNEMHHRYFYHLWCHGLPPARWYHQERDLSDSFESMSIIFEFFWMPLPCNIAALIADHGKMLPQLLDVIAMRESLNGLNE